MVRTSRAPRSAALAFVCLTLIVSGLKLLGCGGDATTETGEGASCPCRDDGDCLGDSLLYLPGTTCDEATNTCVCAIRGYVLCCDAPPPDCDLNCRPASACVKEVAPRCDGLPVGVGTGGAGGLGGAGGAGGASSGTGGASSGIGGQGGGGAGMGGAGGGSMTECSSPADCPQPADGRCGQATCEDGACGLTLIAGPGELVPVPSQARGDCKTVVCDGTGHLLTIQDDSDFYNDGKQCTLDTCTIGEASNELYPDGDTCPEAGAGVCYQGDCVECIDGVTVCPEPGDICDGVYCVAMDCAQKCGNGCAPCPPTYPCNDAVDCAHNLCANGTCAIPTCMDGEKNDGETGIDCGAPSCGSKCPDGQGCAAHTDCISGVCWGGICQAPSCTDAVMNGNEAGDDCGGDCADPCDASP